MEPKKRHPPGLRGREIGMYYRNLNQHRKKEAEPIKLGANVTVPPAVLENVKKCLELSTVGHELEKTNKILNEFEIHFRSHLEKDFDEILNNSEIVLPSENLELDEKFKADFLQKCESAVYQTRRLQREKLPTMIQKDDILKLFLDNQIILIVGSTGCGKSTQVPQIILDYYLEKGKGTECQIVCTQPRRICAISLAERVSYERSEDLGRSVGFQIRLESEMPREHASILYCTTGILLQKMKTDPLIQNVKVIILDEIHERSVEIDILMGLLKKILPKRKDLKIILMSATVSEEIFRSYFFNCPTLQIDGTLYPVETFYLEDILKETGYKGFFNIPSQSKRRHGNFQKRQESNKANQDYTLMIEPYIRQIQKHYENTVLQSLRCSDSEGCANIQFLEHFIYYICDNKPPGAILVFLPGYDKISKLQNALENPLSTTGKKSRGKLQIYPLHSQMPTVFQQKIFQPAPTGMRKVILSTIIAETSVTIDDVVYVINTGKTKLSAYNIDANIQTLDEAWIAKANCQQRKGRAGRVQPGICYNLFTRAREALMDEQTMPEIKRSRLETIILSLKLLHIKDVFKFFNELIDAPSTKAIENGIQLLKRMEALDENELLTPLGMHLANLPLDPQTGKMLLMSALFRCLDPISSVAATLSFKSPFYTPLGQEKRVDNRKHDLSNDMKSDHLLIHNVLEKYRKTDDDKRSFCYDNFLSIWTIQQLERMKQQFAETLKNAKFLESSACLAVESNVNSKNITLLRAIIAAGLYPNMAQLHKTRRIKNHVQPLHTMSTPTERRVKFHPSSVNCNESSFDSNYFVYYLKQKSSAVFLLDSTMVFPMALLIFGDHIETGTTPEGRNFISVGKTYNFACDCETSSVIIQLRQYLQVVLQKKALYPSPIEPNCGDDQIVKAINILLSLDGNSYEFTNDEISFSDDDFY